MTITLQVECYSGHTYAQEPRAFVWRGERCEVQRIVKRWRTPAGPVFRVAVDYPRSQTPAPLPERRRRGGLRAHLPRPGSRPGLRDREERSGAGGASVSKPKSQTLTLVDLQYVEAEDRWTMAVHNTIQEDQR